MKPDRDSLYLGKAGEFHVMADFLLRGYNVAVPEVDIGNDVLVVRDENNDLKRVQVKTAQLDSAMCAQFAVPRAQLESADPVALWYVFVTRSNGVWLPSILISRSDLYAVQVRRARKKEPKAKDINFKVKFSSDGKTVMLGPKDLSQFVENWQAWPSLLKARATQGAAANP